MTESISLGQALATIAASDSRDSEVAAMAQILAQRIQTVLALPVRPWDRQRPNSSEARSARAYNRALATVTAALRGETSL